MPYYVILLCLALVVSTSKPINRSVASSLAQPRLTSSLYVSSDGSDTADGLSAERPLRSLEAARDKGRSIQGLKTIYVSGRFYRHIPLHLNKYDSNLTITSAPGASPIIIGDGKVNAGIIIDGAHHTTISKITLTSFNHQGILAKNTNNLNIEHNTILNTRSNGWSQGAIHLNLSASYAKVMHNLIENADYAGIIVDTDERSSVDRIYIAHNRVINSCRKVADCGGIYINDRGRKSSGSIIEYNIVSNYGNSSTSGRGIYLDDWASHVTVRHNSISGSGTFAFQIHGGGGNKIIHNKVDVVGLKNVILYGLHSNKWQGVMSGNIFSYNRINVHVQSENYTLFKEMLLQEYKPKAVGNILCLVERCTRRRGQITGAGRTGRAGLD